MSYAKITIIGNLGKDPELRYTPEGKPVCSFSMAVSDKRRGDETTTWFKVTFFGRQAEVASQYLSRGKPVYVEGRVRLAEWQDRDGKVQKTLEVAGTEMQFLGGNERGQSAPSQSTREAPESTKAPDPLDDDDVPF